MTPLLVDRLEIGGYVDRLDTEKLIESLTSNLPTGQLIEMSKTCSDLIKYSDSQIQYAEGRRSKFVAIGGTILGGSFGAFLFLTRSIGLSNVNFCSNLCLFLITVFGLVVGFRIIVTFAKQVNYEYPFKGVNNTWKWFYRDNIRSLQDVNEKNRDEYRRAYLDDLELFVENMKGIGETSTHNGYTLNLEQDLAHLFLLHNNNYYKNKFLSEIRNVTSACLKSFSIVSFFLILAYFVLRYYGN